MAEHIVEENGSIVAAEVDVMSFGDDALARIASEADARIEAMKTIKAAALKLTNQRDWVSQNGEPYLCASGAEKIAGIGVRVSNITRDKMRDEDEKGVYYIYEYSGTFSIAERSLEAVGTCSSRDKFFAIRDGKLLPLGEVDQTNIMKAAYSNLLVNGISRLLGYRSLTWDELKVAGIDPGKVVQVQYGKGTEGGSSDEDKDHQRELGEILTALSSGDTEEAKQMLVDLTEFTNKDGKAIKGLRTLKACKGTRLNIALDKARKHYQDAFDKPFGGEKSKGQVDDPEFWKEGEEPR